MTTPISAPVLPATAYTILAKLCEAAAMESVPHTEESLCAVLESGQLSRNTIQRSLGALIARGFVSIDFKNGRTITINPHVDKVQVRDDNYVDPEYVKFVEALFKVFTFIDRETGQEHLDFNATLMHAAIGIAGEGGELLDAAKKAWVYNKPLDRDNMVEELGDMFFYTVKAMRMLGVNLNDVIKKNQAKLAKRYPQGVYSDQHAQARLDKSTTGEQHHAS